MRLGNFPYSDDFSFFRFFFAEKDKEAFVFCKKGFILYANAGLLRLWKLWKSAMRMAKEELFSKERPIHDP